VSGDKDLAQLVNDRITLYDVARDEAFDAAKVAERFGVPPERIPDLLALTGDSIDNIPGIPGIGDKTAVALLQALGSLPAILAHPERIAELTLRNARAVAEKIAAAGDGPRLGLELATIARDAPIAIDPAALAYRGAHRAELEPLCAELDFGPRIPAEVPIWAGETATDLALDFGTPARIPGEEDER
jgi:DNA polymerase-1